MKTRQLILLTAAWVSLSLTAQTFAAAKAYAFGSAASVKSFTHKTLEQCKAAHKPILLYLGDKTPKHNGMAEFMEGATLLADTNVVDAEKNFLCVKCNSTDPDGWPEDLTKLANNGAVVVVFTADMKEIQRFHGQNRNEVTGAALSTAMELAEKASGASTANKDDANKNPANKPDGADKKKKNSPG